MTAPALPITKSLVTWGRLRSTRLLFSAWQNKLRIAGATSSSRNGLPSLFPATTLTMFSETSAVTNSRPGIETACNACSPSICLRRTRLLAEASAGILRKSSRWGRYSSRSAATNLQPVEEKSSCSASFGLSARRSLSSRGIEFSARSARQVRNWSRFSLFSPWLAPVRKFLPVFCRTGSAHFTEDARKVLLVLEPARHRHIQHAHLAGTQHFLGAVYPAVQHKLVRALSR